MTLDTRIRVTAPGRITARQAFDHVATLLGAGSDYRSETKASWRDGCKMIMADPGQVLPAWLIVTYGADGPIPFDDDPDYPVSEQGPQGWVEVSVDTAYGYTADNGAKCSDLHAWLVRETGAWLTERGAAWSWQNEFTGEWDPQEELGNADLGALR